VADIDLSETGGRAKGGIVLAEKLADRKVGVPIILISQSPWSFLPPVGTEEHNRRMESLKVVQVMDRNDSSFWDHLIRCLREIRAVARPRREKL
jgi:hypothetical protein